ncbi:alpha/beta hydrolase [Lacticaseibacillus jixiensis]|uniref:alpha/beta hydrolase n=1 Tax=Lacticaseibacillus jixiensis TaxID=3231926 RepID=UPI0036F2BEBC
MRKFVFDLHNNVERQETSVVNRFGIKLAADVYTPKNIGNKKVPGIVIGGPYGAVKEQASGNYANEMASRGFVAVAFDGSFTGESASAVRNVSSPDINTEDFMAAVDLIGTQPNVDRERIGILGICGWGSFALNAVSIDKRVKAVATVSMFDVSMLAASDSEARSTQLDQLAAQRWADVDAGSPGLGPDRFPDGFPERESAQGQDVYDYYRTPRGFHENSILSNGQWSATVAYPYMTNTLMQHIDEISPRPILLVAGDKADSKPFSEQAYAKAQEPKELYIVPNAGHVTLYDRMSETTLEKLRHFFMSNLR